MTWIAITLGAAVGVILISYLVEAARREPQPLPHLSWAPNLPVRYVRVGDVRLRYITAGEGSALVLLHTLRTQLDMFQKIIPALAAHFRVYALDYPGHGYSDIPKASYSAEFFVTTVAEALERLDINRALVIGESIGGTIALLLAARRNPRVERVVAVNPYDYDRGRGIRRSSMLANVMFRLGQVPVLGPTVNRLRRYPVIKRIFEGGVYRPGALPGALAREMYAVGNRRGYSQAFASLVRHWGSWEAARAEYGNIDRPVLLLYGDHDWSREAERTANAQAIPGAESQVVADAGHFLALDAPEQLVRAILAWARIPAPPPSPEPS